MGEGGDHHHRHIGPGDHLARIEHSVGSRERPHRHHPVGERAIPGVGGHIRNLYPLRVLDRPPLRDRPIQESGHLPAGNLRRRTVPGGVFGVASQGDHPDGDPLDVGLVDAAVFIAEPSLTHRLRRLRRLSRLRRLRRGRGRGHRPSAASPTAASSSPAAGRRAAASAGRRIAVIGYGQGDGLHGEAGGPAGYADIFIVVRSVVVDDGQGKCRRPRPGSGPDGDGEAGRAQIGVSRPGGRAAPHGNVDRHRIGPGGADQGGGHSARGAARVLPHGILIQRESYPGGPGAAVPDGQGGGSDVEPGSGGGRSQRFVPFGDVVVAEGERVPVNPVLQIREENVLGAGVVILRVGGPRILDTHRPGRRNPTIGVGEPRPQAVSFRGRGYGRPGGVHKCQNNVVVGYQQGVGFHGLNSEGAQVRPRGGSVHGYRFVLFRSVVVYDLQVELREAFPGVGGNGHPMRSPIVVVGPLPGGVPGLTHLQSHRRRPGQHFRSVVGGPYPYRQRSVPLGGFFYIPILAVRFGLDGENDGGGGRVVGGVVDGDAGGFNLVGVAADGDIGAFHPYPLRPLRNLVVVYGHGKRRRPGSGAGGDVDRQVLTGNPKVLPRPERGSVGVQHGDLAHHIQRHRRSAHRGRRRQCNPDQKNFNPRVLPQRGLPLRRTLVGVDLQGDSGIEDVDRGSGHGGPGYRRGPRQINRLRPFVVVVAVGGQVKRGGAAPFPRRDDDRHLIVRGVGEKVPGCSVRSPRRLPRPAARRDSHRHRGVRSQSRSRPRKGGGDGHRLRRAFHYRVLAHRQGNIGIVIVHGQRSRRLAAVVPHHIGTHYPQRLRALHHRIVVDGQPRQRRAVPGTGRPRVGDRHGGGLGRRRVVIIVRAGASRRRGQRYHRVGTDLVGSGVRKRGRNRHVRTAPALLQRRQGDSQRRLRILPVDDRQPGGFHRKPLRRAGNRVINELRPLRRRI